MGSWARTAALAGLAVLIGIAPGWTQQGKGSGSAPGPSAPSVGTRTPRPLDRERRVVFISGRVVMEDGTPPPERVSIESVCGGSERREGYSDTAGYFSFQMGTNQNGVMQDASVGSRVDVFGTDPNSGLSPMSNPVDTNPGITETQLMSCELRASLPGYRSTTIPLAGRRLLDSGPVGILVLYSVSSVRGSIVSATSLQAPKDAQKAFKKGHELLEKKKYDPAREQLEKAVAAYPKYADAWFELGLAEEGQRHFEEARKSYTQALQADSRFIRPYLPLAQFALQEQNWTLALDLTEKALALNPFEYPAIHFFNAVANFNLQKFAAAERSARKAELLDSAHRLPRTYVLLSQILAQRGDYQGAAQELRTYFKIDPNPPDESELKAELQRLESRAQSPAKQ